MTLLGPRGEVLIKGYETLRLTAYKPTPDDVLTIGWGHTKGVKPGMVITLSQAKVYFREDTADAISSVSLLHKKINGALTESMTDALISLVFNAGPSAISSGSTIGRSLISRDYFSAWAGFALWRKQAGKDLLGLACRRAQEMSLFLEDGIPERLEAFHAATLFSTLPSIFFCLSIYLLIRSIPIPVTSLSFSSVV